MSILIITKVMKINSISPDKHEFLQRVSTIAKYPKRLYFIGKLPEHTIQSVAIIGSRKPTAYGKEVTFELAYRLAKAGVVIVSGLAYGIDAIAHRAALKAGGTTVAVLAHGLDHIYPRAHQQLANEIIENGGALISEYPEGVQAKPYQFLARNRIISSLVDAVIVTEAGARSGTLATVTYALEQGRDVYAVPGNITSVLSIGPNRLIQQGAIPLLSAADIIGEDEAHLQQDTQHTPNESIIISLLQNGVHDNDELQQQSSLATDVYLYTMTLLELSGTITRHGTNWQLKHT